MLPHTPCIWVLPCQSVAEILQSPFGNDPNDIDLTEAGSVLVDDLQLMFETHSMEMATVFDDDHELDLSSLRLNYERLGKNGVRKRSEFEMQKHVNKSKKA